jgi:hypothetical protein
MTNTHATALRRKMLVHTNQRRIAFQSPSWPGSSRPSTSLPRARKKDVDARDRRGHDDHSRNGVAPQDGHRDKWGERGDCLRFSDNCAWLKF